MTRFAKTTLATVAALAVFGAGQANADTMSNPTNSSSLGFLSGSLTGGNQTQFFGQTFTAPVTGSLTNFQFTLNSSTLQSLYGVVYAWNGTSPTTELWRSAIVPANAGLLDFNPTGVTLTQGQTYVAFISTYGLTSNSGLASIATCLTFVGCDSNTIPNLGTLIIGNVLGNGPEFNPVTNNSRDATFSVTVAAAAVPEPASWGMMIAGFGAIGLGLRRRRQARTTIRFA